MQLAKFVKKKNENIDRMKIADDILNGTYKSDKQKKVEKVQQSYKKITSSPKEMAKAYATIKAAQAGTKAINTINSMDVRNATNKAAKAANTTKKFLTDFDYRNEVGTKALMGAGVGMAQLTKGALKTVENWGDAARTVTDNINNWAAYKTGIIDKKEYEKQKKISEDSIKADAVGDFYKNNLGWNEENAQFLKQNSYVTEDNLPGQLFYGIGQQLPAVMIGHTQAVQNLMTNPALQNVAGDSAIKNIGKGLIRNAPMNAEIGLRSYGGAVEEALQNGATMEEARRYGILNAGTEIATEWMTGGIPGVENTTGLFDKGVDAVIDKATGRLNKETSKAIAKSLLNYGFNALGEGFEEAVSEIFSPLIKNMTYSNGEKIDWQNVLNAGVMGMLQGGILNAPNTIKYGRQDIQQARQVDRANQEAARQQAEQQAREELNQAAQSRLNEIYQQQDQTPIFNQQNRLRELAQQQVQAIQQQVQNGQISPQEGTQQIQDIQRYLQSQEAQTEQQQTPVVEQENTPTINEATQDNINTQEQENVPQNANNETKQSDAFNLKPINEMDIQFGDNNDPRIIVGRQASTAYNETLEQFQRQVKYLTKDAKQAIEDYGGVEKLWKDSQTMSQTEIANNFGKNENVAQNTNNEVEQKPKGKVMSLQEISDRLGVKDNNAEKTIQQEQTNIEQQPAQEQTNIPETKTEPVVKFDNETKKQTAKQITDVLNKNIKNSENADIFDTIEKDTGKKLRGFVKTATNATGDVDLVSKMDKVKITYDQLSNKEIMKQAENYFKDMKYQDGVEDVLDFIKSDKRVTALDMAKIDYMVLQAKARNDMRTYQNLVEEAGIITTQSGQVSQAVSLIQQSDPMFQLSVLNRLIQKEQENGTKQFKGVKIKENLVQEVMNSYDEDGNFDKQKFDKAMDKLKQDIAEQMKVTPMEKADAWRYLSMLGNPKTHIRNVTANIAMKLLQASKNKIAATGEALADVGSKAIRGKGIQRTKTLMPSTKEVKSFSGQTMEDYFNKNKPGSKYNDRITNQKGLKGELLQRRNKFSNKNPVGFLLNLADKGNNAALNWEDNVFNRSAAKSAMANYLTANGIRTQADIDAHPEIVQAAFDYGIIQGQEATFHQKSTTAETIRETREKLRTGSGLSKVAGYGIDATMPFVSTPVNIAKTGVEHTPGLGLLKTITDVQQAPSNMKAAIFIDSLSKQLSGGLLAYAGYLLAKNGWLVGGGDDNDSEKKLEKNLGAMNYALKIGDNYYDVSFLSPSAMPLLMGANLNDATKGKGIDEKMIGDVLYQSLDPLTEMSFMSSVQDVLKSYNSGAKGLSDMGSSALTGYISQYIPTLLSQIASSKDEYKRSTGGNTFIEKTKQKLMYKIPGQREKLPEQVNVWGEAKENYQRGIEVFLNPMNRSKSKVDNTTKELERVYEETGDGLPNMNIKKDQLGTTLNPNDYAQFEKTYGKTAKKELDELVKSDKYKKATDEEKAAMISKIYAYSTHESKREYSNNSGVEYEPSTKYYAMIDAFKIPFNEYTQLDLSNIKGDVDSKGKTIPNSRKKKITKAIEESGLSTIQKAAILKSKYSSEKGYDSSIKKEIENSNLSKKEKENLLKYFKLK